MLRALWYLTKILVVVGLAVFLMVQPGDVVVGWKDYTVTIKLGFAAVTLLIAMLAVSFMSEMVTRVSLWPRNLARARADRRRSKGYRALLQSLSAAAVGDHKTANYLAFRAQKFLPEDESGLPLLLQAQALSRAGKSQGNEEPYRLLLRNADTALLGLQGLTQNAILAGDFQKALLLARQAYRDNPKNHSLLKSIYDLEIRNRLWSDALVTLEKAESKKVILRDDADRDRVAIYLCLGDMAKRDARLDEAYELYRRAYKIDDDCVPAVVRFVDICIALDKRRKALSLLQSAWKREAHPAYIPVWRSLVPEQKSGKPNVKYDWFKWVAAFHPNSEVAQLALARVAIEEGLWGDARVALAAAEKLGSSAEIYELWVLLEEKTSNRADVIRQWLDRAYQAKSGGVWICTKTGRSFPEWVAVVEPEGLFNTLVWDAKGIEKNQSFISVAVAKSS